MTPRIRARLIALAYVGGLGTGCAKLIDKTTYTPSNKDVMVPYVATPDLELALPPSKSTNAPLATTYCQPQTDGRFDLGTKMTGGEHTDQTNGTYYFGEGGACLNRGLLDAWATAMNQPLMVWDDKGNSGTYKLVRPTKGVSRVFDVEYTHVEDGMMSVKVKWYMTWHHTVLLGTPQAPRRVLINYRRYKGTKYIKHWEGSVILTRVSEHITGVWVRNQIRASRVTETEARGGASDIIRKLREGQPAPQFLP